jgi:hypothetical protein
MNQGQNSTSVQSAEQQNKHQLAVKISSEIVSRSLCYGALACWVLVAYLYANKIWLEAATAAALVTLLLCLKDIQSDIDVRSNNTSE